MSPTITADASRTSRRLSLGLAAVLAGISALIIVASGLLYVHMVRTEWADTIWLWLFQRVDVGVEFNIAAWWASAIWLIFAVIAAGVGILSTRHSYLWYILAAVGVFASADEATMIHENFYRLADLVAPFTPTALLSYSWVAVGLVAVVIVAAVGLPLVVQLPWRVVAGIATGGLVFLLGALVMETVGGHIEAHFGQVTWHLMLSIHIEEMLEYLGVTIAVYSLSRMIVVERRPDGLDLRFLGYRSDLRRAAASAAGSAPDGTDRDGAPSDRPAAPNAPPVAAPPRSPGTAGPASPMPPRHSPTF